jgi:hypothetical protein
MEYICAECLTVEKIAPMMTPEIQVTGKQEKKLYALWGVCHLVKKMG